MSTLGIWRNSGILCLGLALAFGLALFIGLLLVMGAVHTLDVALAQGPNTRYVDSATGNDGGNYCTNSGAPCATIQHAVDVADPGDEIRVATGIYTDVQVRTGITQVVYISKTVTLRVTNTGNVTLTVAVTDILPTHATPTGTLTWTPVITAPRGIWTQQFTVAVETYYSGTLTNVVQVTTDEGAMGVYTETSEVQPAPAPPIPPIYLPVILKQRLVTRFLPRRWHSGIKPMTRI